MNDRVAWQKEIEKKIMARIMHGQAYIDDLEREEYKNLKSLLLSQKFFFI